MSAPVPPPTWLDWAELHTRLFRLVSDADLDMVREWVRLLEAANYQPAELIAASRWLALHEPPRYPVEQLAACLARARAERLRQSSRQLDTPAPGQHRPQGAELAEILARMRDAWGVGSREDRRRGSAKGGRRDRFG